MFTGSDEIFLYPKEDKFLAQMLQYTNVEFFHKYFTFHIMEVWKWKYEKSMFCLVWKKYFMISFQDKYKSGHHIRWPRKLFAEKLLEEVVVCNEAIYTAKWYGWCMNRWRSYNREYNDVKRWIYSESRYTYSEVILWCIQVRGNHSI